MKPPLRRGFSTCGAARAGPSSRVPVMPAQLVTLEELLPHIRPGGIYLCEDIIAPFNQFASYVSGLMHELNTYDAPTDEASNRQERIICKPTGFQSAIHSIHSYPFVTVIEKRKIPVSEFVSVRHGTEWESFLK